MSEREELGILRDSVARYLAKWRDAARQGDLSSGGNSSAKFWNGLAALGLFGIGISEADGGIGGGIVEASVVAEELGRALTPSPILQSLLAARLISTLGSASQRETWLPTLLDGAARYGLSLGEASEASGTGIAATPHAGTWRLAGTARHVSGAVGDHDNLLVAAQSAGQDECLLFVIPAVAAGLERQHFQTLDGNEACHLTLDDLRVAPDACLMSGDVSAALAEARDFAATFLANEAVGCMSALLTATIDHLRTREQFGRPLAANQALRHRIADMSVNYEIAASLARRAARAMQDGAPDAARLAAAAKFRAGKAGRYLAEQAVQLHGGMGVTEELDIGRYLKRLIAIDLSFGQGRRQLARYATLSAQARTAA